MIFFYLAIAIAVVSGAWAWRNTNEVFEGIFTTVFVGIFAFLAAVVLSQVIGSLVYDQDVRERSFKVVAASDSNLTEGQFSIFGGFIGETPYYFYYRQDVDGGIRQGRIPADNTVIFEDQETRPFIIVRTCPETMRFWGESSSCLPSYEIHAPKGSVDRSVEFNLEGN